VWAERAFGTAGLQIPTALPTPAMFWGYESQGLIRLGLALLGASVLLLVRWGARWPALAIALIALDLYSVHGTFLQSSDARLSPLLSENTPPVVRAIQERER